MSFKEHNGMLLADHCKSFCLGAANGSEEIVQLMWNETSKTQRFVILYEKSAAAFRKASINGHLSIVQLLWSAANDHQRRQLLSVAKGAFTGAAAQGRLEILDYLWSEMNKESKRFFSDNLLGPCLAESLRNNRSAVFAFMLHLTGLDVADLRRAVMGNNAEVFVQALSSAGGSFAKCFTLLNVLSEEQKTIVLKMVRSEVPEKVWNMFVKEKEENPQAKDDEGVVVGDVKM